MIKSVFRSYLVTLFSFFLLSQYVPGFEASEGIRSLMIISVGFTLLHLLVKPILDTILGGVNFLTLGFLGILIDSAILYGLTIYSPQISLTPWHFSGTTLQGFSIPPYDFNILTTAMLSAFVLNFLRTLAAILV